MDLSRYSKLIAAVVGAIASFAFAWLSLKSPLATCTLVDAKQVCTVLGMSEGEITGLLMGIVMSAAVGFAPKNSSTNEELVKEIAAAVGTDKETKLVKKLELTNTIEGREINAVTPGNVTVAKTPVVESSS